MKNTEALKFDGPAQPYKLRGGEFAVVLGKDAKGNWVGRLLPSEVQSSWDQLGRDIDGDTKYDLMELVRPNTPTSTRFKEAVERLLAPAK